MFDTLSPDGIIAAALIAPPGADVLAALASIDPRSLTEFMQVDLLAALDRQTAWLAALMQPALAAVGDSVEATVHREPGDPLGLAERAAHAEIAAALRLSDSTAGGRLALARTLTVDLPAVQEALAAGDISLWHANAIAETTNPLSREKARIVADRVLPRARHQTVGQLRRCLRRAVLAVEPTTAAERAKKAHAERGLEWWTRPDGMAELRLIASAADIMTVFNAADTIAQQAKTAGPKPGDDGWLPIDALRSDALIQLITQGGTKIRPAAVHVTIDLATLLGLQDNPAELAGYGPIPAPLARTLAADGRWRRLIYDPLTGHLLDLGHTSYQPSAPLARYVKARDQTCISPTCNRTSQHCEIDHTRPYRPGDPTGGRTDRDNLKPGCGNHHTLKHHGQWKLRNDTKAGLPIWTSPTGHTYPAEPHDHRPETAFEPCPF